MQISTPLVLSLGAIFFFAVPFAILFIKNKKAFNWTLSILFALYVALLLCGVWFQTHCTWKSVSITPDFSGEWCAKSINWNFSHLTMFDTIINLVMFIPLGIFISFKTTNKSTISKIILLLCFGFFAGMFVELSQFILPVPRSVQMSDIFFNMLSTFVGGMIGFLYLWIFNKISKRQKN